jgi:site-specific DNA-cytosine methylase
MKEINILSLCDGMACGLISFIELGIKVNYYAIEIDKYPRMIADGNFPNIIRPTHDVTQVTEEIINNLPIFDWVIFGSPCQNLSIAGNGTGLEGIKSKVFFDCMKVLKMCQKRNPNLKYIIENVASMRKIHKLQMSEFIGHDCVMIDSALVSAQSRKRLYWCNFPIEQPEDLHIYLPDIIDQEFEVDREKAYCLDANYAKGASVKDYLNKGRRQLAFAWSKSVRSDGSFDERIRTDNKSNNLTASGIKGTEARTLIVKEDLSNFKPRKVFDRKDLLIYNIPHRLLNINECRKLQTIPDWYRMDLVSKNQAYKALGNGWNINTIKHIIQEGFKKDQ